VATTVTLAGAGYGVVYRPAEVMFPTLPLYPEGPVTDHVTPLVKGPFPFTVAANWRVVPMVAEAGFGVIVTAVGPSAT
jgi:hypothetical protein